MKSKMIPVKLRSGRIIGHVWKNQESDVFPFTCEHVGTGMSWGCETAESAVSRLVEFEKWEPSRRKSKVR